MSSYQSINQLILRHRHRRRRQIVLSINQSITSLRQIQSINQRGGYSSLSILNYLSYFIFNHLLFQLVNLNKKTPLLNPLMRILIDNTHTIFLNRLLFLLTHFMNIYTDICCMHVCMYLMYVIYVCFAYKLIDNYTFIRLFPLLGPVFHLTSVLTESINDITSWLSSKNNSIRQSVSTSSSYVHPHSPFPVLRSPFPNPLPNPPPSPTENVTPQSNQPPLRPTKKKKKKTHLAPFLVIKKKTHYEQTNFCTNPH